MQSNNSSNSGSVTEVSSPAVQAVKRRWCFKIAILGDSGVGKTWLVESALSTSPQDAEGGEVKEHLPHCHSQEIFYHQEQGTGDAEESRGTIGVTFNLAKLELDGSTVLLQVWDTSGKDRYRGLLANYMTDLSCVIIAYNPCCESAEASCQSLAQWHQFVLESSGQMSMAAVAPVMFCVVAIGGDDGCRSPQTCDHVRCLAVGRAFADTLRGRFFQCRRGHRHQCQVGCGDGRCDRAEGELTAQWLGRELLRRHFKSLARLLEEEEEEAAADVSGLQGGRSCCQKLARSLQVLASWPSLAVWVLGRRLRGD